MILSFGFWAYQLSRPEHLGCVFWAPNNSESCMSQLAALHRFLAVWKFWNQLVRAAAMLHHLRLQMLLEHRQVASPLWCGHEHWRQRDDLPVRHTQLSKLWEFKQDVGRKSSTTTNKCNGNSTSDSSSSKHQELLGLLMDRPCPLSHVNNLKQRGSPSYAWLGPLFSTCKPKTPNDCVFR